MNKKNYLPPFRLAHPFFGANHGATRLVGLFQSDPPDRKREITRFFLKKKMFSKNAGPLSRLLEMFIFTRRIHTYFCCLFFLFFLMCKVHASSAAFWSQHGEILNFDLMSTITVNKNKQNQDSERTQCLRGHAETPFNRLMENSNKRYQKESM